jgi:phosphoserine phosphatase
MTLDQRLVVLDMDSTFIQQEVIDLLAHHAGVGDQVAAITERSMRGELDFKASLKKRVALLKGLPQEIFEEVRSEISLSRGAREMVSTLHKHGHKVAVVSGGFANVIAPFLESEGVDYFRANNLEVVDGKLTGLTIEDVIDREAKAKYLQELATLLGIPLSATVAVGDGANDLGMMEIAGLSIAFNAKPVVRERAQAAINNGDLFEVVRLMGLVS